MFAEQVKPFIIPGKKYSFVIDLTDDPYYGEKKGDYVVGGKRKASTNRFFSYATCYFSTSLKIPPPCLTTIHLPQTLHYQSNP